MDLPRKISTQRGSNPSDAYLTSDKFADHLSRYRLASGMSRYSGPEPQPIPFPPELVMRILSYLDQICDKKNARLVCKGFAAASLTSLTSTVYFSTSLIQIVYRSKLPHCLSSTQDIAMHPVVSKYITKMVCDGTQLSDSHLRLEAFQDWWATLGKNPTSCSIRSLHSIYTSRHQQEKWIIGRSEDRMIFRTALEHFVNLKSVVFTDVAADEQSRDLPRPTWPSAVPEGDLWGASSPYHSFAMCIRSLSEMAIKLHELRIEGRQNAISHSIFSLVSSQDYNHLRNVFANLCKISVHVNTHRDTYPLEFAGLGRYLTHATLVQSLDLKSTGGRRRQSRLVLSKLFQNTIWPHLKHVGLHGFDMHTDAELIAFFDRHRTTIDSVTLRSIFLHEKDFHSIDVSPCEAWKHFFGELRKRSISFQTLDLFKMYDCCNSEYEDPDLAFRAGYGGKVLEYLRVGGPNPLESYTISETSV